MSQNSNSNKNLKTAFFLNLGFTIFELFGGFYVNSIAIISDALHDLGDSLSIGISWYLQEKSKQKASRYFSFGYRRLSLLGALINSIILVSGSIFVIYKAVERILNPELTDAQGMMFFAIIGVVVNGYAAWRMSSGKTLNERVISLHLIEDVLGWTAIFIVSIVLQVKYIPYLDPILSIAITTYILWNVFKRLKETLFLFLQGQPTDIDKELIEQEILAITNVNSVHHTHIWSLDGEQHVFTTHVKLSQINTLQEYHLVKKRIKYIMKKYPFESYTIEIELKDEDCGLKDKLIK